MTRTRMLNVAGIAVALVLAGSWALGVLWGGHRETAAAARAPQPSAVTATGTPSAERVQHSPAHPRHSPTPGARPSAAADTASAVATAAATHAATHHVAASHPSASGSSHPSASPSSHPSSSGSSTPTPSPSPSGDLLSGLLGGLGHLGH